ncbi:hypothetical protein [Thalassovita aquimarina]|uniref:Phage protein n=1 Tax=Thalassovita aquimarina TaxID=2785917 RepID=A0ABS5HSQ3_9RHOB|nr:hypothetical protein [Thalassovita aquimarina]MBR9651938.1 hypothetical protein [Thalassovita aquimarina]
MADMRELQKMRREAFLRDVRQAQEFDFIEQMEIVSVEDANTCAFCAAQNGKRYPKASVPELPHSEADGCNCVIGCRCIVIAVVPDDF